MFRRYFVDKNGIDNLKTSCLRPQLWLARRHKNKSGEREKTRFTSLCYPHRCPTSKQPSCNQPHQATIITHFYSLYNLRFSSKLTDLNQFQFNRWIRQSTELDTLLITDRSSLSLRAKHWFILSLESLAYLVLPSLLPAHFLPSFLSLSLVYSCVIDYVCLFYIILQCAPSDASATRVQLKGICHHLLGATDKCWHEDNRTVVSATLNHT